MESACGIQINNCINFTSGTACQHSGAPHRSKWNGCTAYAEQLSRFTVTCNYGDNEKLHPGYPTIYRIDRIQTYQITDESFSIPYRDRFEEGEFRKRIPFMYGGKLQKKQFLYTGPDINAVLDRLPTAKAVKQKDGSYLVDVEVFGSIGLTMWLNSQGDYVKILS